MKYVADYVHSKGLKFGMYSCCGLMTCAGYPGSFGHEFDDANYFASVGVDYLKYDNCYHPTSESKLSYARMGLALRQTGRDIMQVNISQIKSMWVGESEKNIKEIFDRYRIKVEKASIAPILLFNEADGIIGKRQEGAERAVDKMENSIQNIILQEMENLKGILIATTNLAQNMDKAFERRFLYKIKFNKPSLEARMQIWQTMLPALSKADIRALAEKYDFSGGQIENIARHYAIDGILHGEDSISLETLMSHCDNERLGQREIGKIGFRK